MNPVCSVIIPAFNAEKYISEAIDSVLVQECDFDFEIIVVDDGSADRTADVVRQYGDKVRLIPKVNGGPGSARNVGVREAKSDVVLFLDADDRMSPARLAHQGHFMLTHSEIALSCGKLDDAGWCANGKEYGSLPQDEDGFEILDGAYHILIAEGGCAWGSTMAVRRELFLAKGGMREDVHVAEDYDYACRVSVEHPIAYTRERLIWCRRDNPLSLTSSHHTYYGLVRVLCDSLLMCADMLTRAELHKGVARFRRQAWALTRHEWAFGGRAAAVAKLNEFQQLLPLHFRLFWRIATLCPPAAGRSVRRILHRVRGRTDSRWEEVGR